MPADNARMLRCGVLATFEFDWATSIMLATPGIDFCTLSAEALGLDYSPNPFGLTCSDSVDVVVVSTTWYLWLMERHPDSVDQTFGKLERLATAIVGLDASDEFALSLPPAAFERFSIVLKPQGLYRDRELYNYHVGSTAPGANWTGKTDPRSDRYSVRDLDKLRLSVPCILLDFPAIRRAARRREESAATTLDRRMPRQERILRDVADAALGSLVGHAPVRARPWEVHCLVQLSHVQRIEALRYLSGFSGVRGITAIREAVQGTPEGWKPSPEARAQITAEAAPFMHPAVPRSRFMYQLCRHRIGVAPTGFGELGQRHAAIMLSGAALVCQDLGHVEMMFSIEGERNAVFCKPDLSDLRSTVQALLADEDRRLAVASNGRASLAGWMTGWREHLLRGISDHLWRAYEPSRQA